MDSDVADHRWRRFRAFTMLDELGWLIGAAVFLAGHARISWRILLDEPFYTEPPSRPLVVHVVTPIALGLVALIGVVAAVRTMIRRGQPRWILFLLFAVPLLLLDVLEPGMYFAELAFQRANYPAVSP